MIKINRKLYITLFTTVFSLKFKEDGECFIVGCALSNFRVSQTIKNRPIFLMNKGVNKGVLVSF